MMALKLVVEPVLVLQSKQSKDFPVESIKQLVLNAKKQTSDPTLSLTDGTLRSLRGRRRCLYKY